MIDPYTINMAPTFMTIFTDRDTKDTDQTPFQAWLLTEDMGEQDMVDTVDMEEDTVVVTVEDTPLDPDTDQDTVAMD